MRVQMKRAEKKGQKGEGRLPSGGKTQSNAGEKARMEEKKEADR